MGGADCWVVGRLIVYIECRIRYLPVVWECGRGASYQPLLCCWIPVSVLCLYVPCSTVFCVPFDSRGERTYPPEVMGRDSGNVRKYGLDKPAGASLVREGMLNGDLGPMGGMVVGHSLNRSQSHSL